ncbi:DUF2637 domain-containing protein [Streptomyces coeruleorubidus]|uniref:DUF2637 domain-containing protein n=1 Tax=Streptomyces coeruleorubidus TaxID=116188 RepID=UPI0033AA1923
MARPLSTARFATMSEAEIRSAERTLKAGTWAITAGALLFSVLTVTPLVRSVSPPGWEWTAPILPLVVDAAVIIVVQLDSVISRLGGSGGAWPALLRWMTGVMTLALNIGNSALHHDWVGMAVHSVAPLLLIVTAEAGLAYRRAISTALARIAREQAEEAAKQRAEREAREQRERDERERARAEKEKQEREAREHAAKLERERAEREEARLREEREYALALERERTEREEAARKAEADLKARELAAKLERERAEREHAARLERERAEREAAERRRLEEREDAQRREEAQRQERARAERERQAARQAAPSITLPGRPKQAVPAKAEKVSPRVVAVVMDEEFAGMTMDQAEAALFELYRAARDASPYGDWEQDPLAKPGGEFCGSNLGRRLGRSDVSGRTKVKPKFEKWYEEYLRSKESAGDRELVGVS